ncbi:MAG: hypothetical protein GY874_20275 [Desulfobacteraceae bacterium]|nr:hypothetical protein [Desulfobacteraceae bacterium]
MGTFIENKTNLGLLIMRLGLAATLLVYAVPRLIDGKRAWSTVGKNIRFLQGDVSAQVLGAILLVIEVLAAMGMITGYFFRLFCICLAGIYAFYFFNYFSAGYTILPLYAASLTIVSIGLLISGPGQFAVAVKIEKK